MHTAAHCQPSPARCVRRRVGARGLSLVELLVGLGVGLLIVAAGLSVLSASLREQRSLMLESRLTQDLRTAADIVTHELRRSGYWASATAGVRAPGSAGAANPYTELGLGGAASDPITFRYSRDAVENNRVDGNEQFGFRLRGGVLEMQLGANNWQALSDSGVLTVTRFSATPSSQEISLRGYCAASCPADSATCPPRLQVRSVALAISARAVADPAVVRSVTSSVRLRNDVPHGACPA